MAAIPAGHIVGKVFGGGDVPVKVAAVAKVLETTEGVAQVCAMMQFALKGLGAVVEGEDAEVAGVLKGAAQKAGTGLGVLSTAGCITAPIKTAAALHTKDPKTIFKSLATTALTFNATCSFLGGTPPLPSKFETHLATTSRLLDAFSDFQNPQSLTRALLDTTALGAFSTPEAVSSLAGFVSAAMWLRKRIADEEISEAERRAHKQ